MLRESQAALDINSFIQTDTTVERGGERRRVVDLIKINAVRQESNQRKGGTEAQRCSFNGINRSGMSAGSVAVSMVTHPCVTG